MKHTHTQLLVLILSLGFFVTVTANVSDELIWDGKSKKQEKNLFFSPFNSGETVFSTRNRRQLEKVTNTDSGTNNTTADNTLGSDYINMVEIFGGCITSAEQDQKTIDVILNEKCVDDFYISSNGISNAQYGVFLTDTKGFNSHPVNKFPVENVTQDDALSFALWLSKKQQKEYQLPINDQWKYAEKAGVERLESGFHVVINN